jgi:hypothetical protein
MRALLGLRVILTLFVAVLMPLESGHCALMPLQASAVAIEPDNADGDDHDCCPESAPSREPTSPTDACCCVSIALPAATTPASVYMDSPTSVPAHLAVVTMFAAPVSVDGTFGRLEPDTRSGSPPDPSSAPQSPRSPPYFA